MINILVSVFFLGGLGIFSSLVNAQVVTVEVGGLVTGATCNIGLEGSSNPLVTLPKVAASQLSKFGKTAGEKTIALKMTNCNLSGNKTVTPFFLPGGNVSGAEGRLRNIAVDGAATNVELEILYQGRPVDLSGDSGSQGAGSVVIDSVNGNATMLYVVRYYAIGQVEAGKVYSNMVWDITYD